MNIMRLNLCLINGQIDKNTVRSEGIPMERDSYVQRTPFGGEGGYLSLKIHFYYNIPCKILFYKRLLKFATFASQKPFAII